MFGKKLSRAISIICVMAIAFMCLTTGIFAYEPTKSPKIEFFKASATNVEPGETVTLSWRVLGAKSVEITGEEKEIECILEDSIEIWPMVTTTYTLHAYGFNKEEVTSSVTVQVGAAEIRSFTATSSEVAPGEDVTLSWDVYNAESISIKETNSGELQPQGSIIVNPYVTTTYTLQAKGFDGVIASKEVLVKVKGPEIISFKADKTVIVPGDTVVLSWDVINAKDVNIKGIEKEPELNGSVEVWPLTTTTYILEAIAFDGSVVTKEITVSVKSPIITSFAASKTKIVKGELVTLTWETKNAVKCSIETSLGQKIPKVAVNGKISVTPNKNIVFTLIAVDESGNTAKADVAIEVIP